MNVNRFKIPVNCATDIYDAEEIYYDYGMIAFPGSYSEKGEATRLVISCHGAGGTVTTDDSQVEQQILTKYLLANGYAVMDVNGLPAEFALKKGIDVRNNIGSPIASQSYIKAYRYCIDNFNLKKEIFVHGASMGGISSTNFVLSNAAPVIAQSGFCPVLDTYNQIYLHPWTNGAPKIALEKIYKLEFDKNGDSIYDESKIQGYNPMGRILLVEGSECLTYPVPVKFWHCEDDDIVNVESTKRFVKAIKNAGGIAELCTFESGGHQPQLCGDILSETCGTTEFQGEVLNITPAVDGVLSWIKHFERIE